MNRCLPEDENEDGWRWEKTKRGDVHYSCAEKKPICRIYTWHRKLESESDGKQERGMRSYLTKLHFKLTWMWSCCWLGCVFAMPQYSFKTHDHGRYSICNLSSKWLHIETKVSENNASAMFIERVGCQFLPVNERWMSSQHKLWKLKLACSQTKFKQTNMILQNNFKYSRRLNLSQK